MRTLNFSPLRNGMAHAARLSRAAAWLALAVLTGHAIAATTDIAGSPLQTSTAALVKPNIFFVLDDSGSMAWDFLPDWARTSTVALGRNSGYNGTYYDPGTTYTPPTKFDGSSYNSMTSANTSAWTAVPFDGFGVQVAGERSENILTTSSSGTTQNLVSNAYSYNFIPGEYCTSQALRTCVAQTAPSATYPFPALLRWCSDSALTNCQASRIETAPTGGSTYLFARYPGYSFSSATATITVGGSGATTVTGITVNGQQILTATTASTSNTGTQATNIASGINSCTSSLSGNCTVTGYSATRNGSVVTITAPASAGNLTATAVVTRSTTSQTFTVSAFSGGNAVPGSNLQTSIVSGTTSYPYPGSATKASTRTDCTGTTCTYAEEMTNYANWWAYYRTRMQMTKSAASLAFGVLTTSYRLGYMSINNNNSSTPDFLNVADITTGTGGQKDLWYRKFTAAKPSNGTGLRVALATAGRMYAGKLNGSQRLWTNASSGDDTAVTVTDPMQYACQRNFTILSTDGYWNDSEPSATNARGISQVDGTTPIGNQDGGEPRPYYDGSYGIGTLTTGTSTSGTTATVVGGITVDGAQIMSAASTSTNTAGATGSYYLAQAIVARINACTSASTGNCTVSGYSASFTYTTTTNSRGTITSTTATITVTAPAGVNATNTPEISVSSGNNTVTANAISPANLTDTNNTLADVAQYYYATDIRRSDLSNANGVLGTDVASNNVADTQQRMYTYTVGLGASGYMQYQSNYKSATSGNYYEVAQGVSTSTTTAGNGICSWQTSGNCNWPTPVSGAQTTIDDLWHAAVNGRGTYYSAANPSDLKSGLSNFLQSVNASTANAAAATTSNPNVAAGDNFVFKTTFRSVAWYGELARYTLDLTTGNVSTVADWSESGTALSNATTQATTPPLLDNKVYTTRNLYTFDPSNTTSTLIPFQWGSLTATMQNYFKVAAIGSLAQMCAVGTTCLSAADKVDSTPTSTTGVGGYNLVNFLRGERANEGPDVSTYYYQRAHVLGDVVDSQSVYVKAPQFAYADTGYATFRTNNTSRQGMVYVGANDGMVHAFNADNGAEQWAYIPSMLLPNLYKLADKNYSANHTFFVNATPRAGDVYFANDWHTILVGGLAEGGRGFYALDITDPATPKVLWEFTSNTSAGTGYTMDADLGYSFGTPVITKLSDGTWAVIVSSGYNNVSPGSGSGIVWVLNAQTGAVIKKIDTGIGSNTATITGCTAAPCPSGLTKLSAYVESASTNNTALRLYGGDLYGNLFRIDLTALTATTGAAPVQLLATLADGSGNRQPITSRIELSNVNGATVVYVGTGRYLGLGDISTTATQTIYAIKDPLTTSTASTGIYGSPHATANTCTATSRTGCFVKQTYADSSTGVRTATSTVTYSMNFATMNGWYADLPETGERIDNDPDLQLGTLAFTSNIPSSASACSIGGSSYINFVDYKTGLTVAGSTNIGNLLSNGTSTALASAVTLVRLPSGKVIAITNLSDGTTVTSVAPINAVNARTRRVSWRELINGF